MASAKEIHFAPIASSDARALTVRHHYSGKFVRNSQLHLGAFIDGDCQGVMSFGPPMDKSKLLPLVADTAWTGILELNRMAFSDALPRNSESRALAVARRLIFQRYPQIEWLVTFADATQCGDGTIYRAAGFDLTGIRPNISIYEFPTGDRFAMLALEAHWQSPRVADLCQAMAVPHVYRTRAQWRQLGARPLPGFMLRYQTFRDDSVKVRLTVPILPKSVIVNAGAGMVRGINNDASDTER